MKKLKSQDRAYQLLEKKFECDVKASYLSDFTPWAMRERQSGSGLGAGIRRPDQRKVAALRTLCEHGFFLMPPDFSDEVAVDALERNFNKVFFAAYEFPEADLNDACQEFEDDHEFILLRLFDRLLGQQQMVLTDGEASAIITLIALRRGWKLPGGGGANDGSKERGADDSDVSPIWPLRYGT